MTTENAEKDISDIVGALTDPIIVFPGGGGIRGGISLVFSGGSSSHPNPPYRG